MFGREGRCGWRKGHCRLSGREGRGGASAIWVAINTTPLCGVLPAISGSSVVGHGEGESGTSESGAVVPEARWNSGGTDDCGSVVRACTCDELSAQGLEDYEAVECGCVRTAPADRTEGRAKHSLLDGHGAVCHVPLIQVAVSPCMHAVSPAVVSHNENCRRRRRHARGHYVRLQGSVV